MSIEHAAPSMEILERAGLSARFRRYERYRGTGIPNVKCLPAHWLQRPLKRVCRINPSKLPDTTDTDFEMEYLDIGNVSFVEGITATERLRFVDAPTRARRCVQDGDTIISTVRTYLKAVARITDRPDNLIVSTGFAVLRPGAEVEPDYLYRVVQSEPLVQRVVAHSTGVSYPAINPSELGSLEIPLPPLEEQRAIASFLERETARIDELVAKKERLIQFLHEKRAALIRHAITGGSSERSGSTGIGVLHPSVLPAEWRVVRIKHLLRKMIDTEHKTAPFYDDGEFFVVRTANVRNGRLLRRGAKYTDEDGYREWTRRGRPEPGDIVFTREAPAGEACVVPADIPICLGQRTVLFKVDTARLDSAFAVHALYCGIAAAFIGSLSQGTTVDHFNMSDIGNIPLLVPDISEQRRLGKFAERVAEQHDSIADVVRKAIVMLREYRMSLIAAAVTGQIDVRDFQPECLQCR